MARARWTVEFVPEERGKLVTLHAHWRADNGRETAVFATEEEARTFASRRWGPQFAHV